MDNALASFNRWFDPTTFALNYRTEDFERLALLPSIDIVDDKNEIKIEVEIPGMDENDVKVTCNNGVLTIQGEKSTSTQDKDRNYTMREIKYGKYERNIALPEGVDTDKAKASFKKGMLWVKIPKKPEFTKGSKEIKIETTE